MSRQPIQPPQAKKIPGSRAIVGTTMNTQMSARSSVPPTAWNSPGGESSAPAAELISTPRGRPRLYRRVPRRVRGEPGEQVAEMTAQGRGMSEKQAALPVADFDQLGAGSLEWRVSSLDLQ